jgi:hypothetical protein
MSVFTMPLWRVLELNQDPYDPSDEQPALGSGYTIGLDRYPIFDEKERLGINRLIIDQFWNREIGTETISMFTFFLRRTMRQIMPTYNQLYKSSLLTFDPLSTYDLTTVRDGTSTENTSGNSTSNTSGDSTGQSRSVYFDTPQTALARNKDYAANATDAESTSHNTGTSGGQNSSEATATNKDTSGTTGRQGSANRLLAELRANIINTDLMLLGDPELTSCFFLLWDTGDEILPPHRLDARAIPGRILP